MPSPSTVPFRPGGSGAPGLNGPTFFLIGAAKAATSSLASLLEQHPEAAIARGKEPHFFSFDPRYRQGWEAYLTLFAHGQGRKALGDASTSYSRLRHHPATLERIARHVPDPKIIYMVRHPLERMVSAYAEHLRTPGSLAMSSINEAVERQPMIVDSSRYWEVYDAYRNAFGESNLHVVWFEDYVARTGEAFQEVCRFLGIADTFVPDLRTQVRNERAGSVDPARFVWQEGTRRRVLASIQEDNLRFLSHFGKPLSHWGGLFTP